MLKKYNQFLNESILDHLKGPSEEEVQNYLRLMELNRLLNNALKSGNTKMIKHYIEQGADIHTENDYALRWSAEHGHLDIVKYLVEHGADIHIYNEYALRYAFENDHFDVVKYLIEQGADIHVEDDYILGHSANNGHLDLVKYCVKYGADIHVNKNSALRWSASNGHLDVVKYLVEHGADIHADDEYALKNAATHGHLDVVKYLVEQGADLRANYHSAYNYATRNNSYVNVVDYLKSQMKFPYLEEIYNNIMELDIEQRLYNFAELGMYDGVVYCLKNIKNLNYYYDLAKIAIKGNNIKIVKLLINNGININNSTDCLIEAVKNRNLEMLKYLVSLGLKLNFRINLMNPYTFNKITLGLIEYAALNNSPDIIEYLVQNGLDVNAPYQINEENKPLYLAVNERNIEAVEMLLKYNATITDAVKLIVNKSTEIIKQLIKNKLEGRD